MILSDTTENIYELRLRTVCCMMFLH